MNRLNNLVREIFLASVLEYLRPVFEALLSTLYYERIAISGNKSSTQIDIDLLLGGQKLWWSIPNWASCGHCFTISLGFSGRNQISLDRKDNYTRRYGSTDYAYDGYVRKIATFAKVYYLEYFAWFSFASQRASKNFQDYLDYSGSILLKYSEYVLDSFITELKLYAK